MFQYLKVVDFNIRNHFIFLKKSIMYFKSNPEFIYFLIYYNFFVPSLSWPLLQQAS